MAKKRPIVLIHGYSDEGAAYEKWTTILEAKGYDVTTIHTCTYKSLTNEITIKDIAEGLNRALKIRAGLDSDDPFDAIVHSTGMLVIRSWLMAYGNNKKRLKRLIALAPATFGSPMAHKGRSWLGSIFKGNRDLGPDFMEAGDLVLDGLELGSRFTWDLIHKDVLGTEMYYGPTKTTPYPFILCGNKAYTGLRQLANEPGTDGTVRWAGCSLNCRKISIDLADRADQSAQVKRWSVADWSAVDEIPFIPLDGLNHATILSDPSPLLMDLVARALEVESEHQFREWQQYAGQKTKDTAKAMRQWQQFVVRATDERGDPITDYHLELFSRGNNKKGTLEFDLDVHAYTSDKSFRCFHVQIEKLQQVDNLWLRLMAISGSQFVSYHGVGSNKFNPTSQTVDNRGKWDAELDITGVLKNPNFKFFYPFTTTLIELRLDREPFPFTGRTELCFFPEK